MSDLSDEAQRLFALATADAPTAEGEGRLRERLESEVGFALPVAAVAVTAGAVAGVAAATASAGGATGAASAGGAAVGLGVGAAAATTAGATGGAGLLVALVAGSLVVASGVGVTVAMRRAPEVRAAHAVSRVAPTPGGALGAGVAEATADGDEASMQFEALRLDDETASGVDAPSTAPRERRARAAVTPVPVVQPDDVEASSAEDGDAAPASTVVRPCDAEDELQSVLRAEVALTRHDGAGALKTLETFYAECPTGVWHPRAWAVRVGALCLMGRVSDATSLTQWHRDEYGNSGSMGLARDVCPLSVFGDDELP